MAEAVDPIILNMKLVDVCQCRPCDCSLTEIPQAILDCFGDSLTQGGDVHRLYVTLGQFSIIRLERDSQLLMPVFDYCMPDKDCSAGCGCTKEDPCELFQSICFPVDQFFPPNAGGDGGSCPGGCQNSGCQSNGCQNGNSCFCK